MRRFGRLKAERTNVGSTPKHRRWLPDALRSNQYKLHRRRIRFSSPPPQEPPIPQPPRMPEQLQQPFAKALINPKQALAKRLLACPAKKAAIKKLGAIATAAPPTMQRPASTSEALKAIAAKVKRGKKKSFFLLFFISHTIFSIWKQRKKKPRH